MRKAKVLLVDDDETILASLGHYLKKNEYDVDRAANGEEAVDKIHTTYFDMIITDLAMDGIGGMEVIKAAKNANPEVCTLVLTGYGCLDTAIEALRSGADDYLLKPCDADELVAKVQHCLQVQEAYRKIKIYENILPVCMYCKKIRDDTGTDHGKGKWLRIETYLHRKSGTDISHGCCPECFDQHKYD